MNSRKIVSTGLQKDQKVQNGKTLDERTIKPKPSNSTNTQKKMELSKALSKRPHPLQKRIPRSGFHSSSLKYSRSLIYNLTNL